ncbi:hypothetical protein H6G20_19525 [Desertifilum sp. FACHB-1129]|uniref:Uncharacterized protein n=2 Tax=Desertifilum tharense IPPAS B-1220 TaxID=1781255 RepID=A0A1E5QQL3_9CYAN|nr:MULTISPECIES: hypothetical protein [Desertifilum]MDA0212458.1 hypothetical protein [Cyanobacteria bacterium FC1]MBD2313864.1 hypothetical protein [Desertifilum sp. FACHB-1129]MBD2323229.1 hypothetical protein [Desertifilum sp. FACHB-866]MBD2333074.1 hypothetical protein [Desertifilum sp. FACHB-868]OEJ76911.1 hypothetical protein BH720_01585 [Desertifilum tharense IPPAS B-1220]
MKSTDANILKAFLAALSQLSQPLPEAINQQINAIGLALAKGDTKAIQELEEIAYKNPQLELLYDPIACSLQEKETEQERNKLFEPNSLPLTDRSDLTLQENIVAPLPPPPPRLPEIATPILQSPQPQEAAKVQLAKINENPNWFLGLLF